MKYEVGCVYVSAEMVCSALTVLAPKNYFAVFYGITKDAEVMVADSSASSGRSLGIYEASIYTMPIQNLCRADDVFMIINKPT